MNSIWVLGAGASIGHSNGEFPSIDQFFSKAKELKITCDSSLKIKNEYKLLSEYIKNIFGKSITDNNPKLDIEKLLTYIEIDIQKFYSGDLYEIRQKILTLIRKIFKEISLDNKSGEYNLFADELLNKKDTIITFNWDLLLDNVLFREGILGDQGEVDLYNTNKHHYFNFLNEISAIRESTIGGISPSRPYLQTKDKGYYLKLHGSTDWLYCSNKSCSNFGKVFPVYEPLETYYCSNCHEEVSILLIPPVLNKEYESYPFITSLWNRASRELEKAEKLIIWGYSLPTTDFYSDWLLRRARKAVKEIIIINPEAIIKGNNSIIWNEKFLNKYLDLYTNVSFGNFHFYEYMSDFNNDFSLKQKYNLSQIG